MPPAPPPTSAEYRARIVFRKFGDLVAAAMLVLFAAVLAYARLQADQHPPGQMRKYYVVAGLGMALFATVLKLPAELKTCIALATVSVVLCLYTAELLFLLAGTSRSGADVPAGAGTPFDTRSKAEVVHDLRARGVDAHLVVYPSLFVESDGMPVGAGRLYPLAFISGKHIVLCNESGEWVGFDSDEHGFDNPPGAWGEAPVEVALIGDSFAQGECVGTDENISAGLRRHGRATLNLGCSGAGPLIELAILREYAAARRPPVVLWLYFEGNDLSDLARERTSPVLMRYLSDDRLQGLMGRQAEIDRALAGYVQAAGGSDVGEVRRRRRGDSLAGFVLLRDLRQRLDMTLPPAPQPTPLFEEVLKRARAEVSSWGGRLYFVYLPAFERYAREVNQEEFCGRGEVLGVVRKLGIAVIDLHPPLSALPDPRAAFPRTAATVRHYNAAAYGLAADTIASSLDRDADRERAATKPSDASGAVR